MLFLLLAAITLNVEIAPLLPREIVSELFEDARVEYEDRWDNFSNFRSFVPFERGRSDQELKDEYDALNEVRYGVWYRNPNELIKESTLEYIVDPDILFDGGARAKNCVPFLYNSLSPYNASRIFLDERYSIACEGPRAQHVDLFYTLLTQLHVTHVVRLTTASEGDIKKCHPYWEDHLQDNKLLIPLDENVHYPVHYFVVEEWRDNSGIEPNRLLNLVLSVKESLDSEDDSLLAVHCSAGVGRTGTFLAALAIVDAIDRDELFSIEEIVYRLSLQRVHSVGRASQYITLYRLAEKYLSK